MEDFEISISQSWVAIKGISPKKALEIYRLQTTGKKEDIPFSPITAITLPNKWFILIMQESEHLFTQEKALRKIPAEYDVLTCHIDEDLMHMQISCWEAGNLIWSVMYDTEENGIEAGGLLPKEFNEVSARLKAETSYNGTAEIPAELGKVLTGYRHDEDIEGMEKQSFHVLKRDRLKLVTKILGK